MDQKPKVELAAQPREVTGKGVQHLRRQGLIPAHVFGHGGPSLAVQFDAKEFDRILHRVGLNKLFTIVVDGGSRSVLVRGVARDRLKGTINHVDLQEVALDESIRATVPVVLTGEPSATRRDVIVMRLLDHVNVEGLPTQLPSALHADLARLASAGDMLHVRDLDLPDGVTVLDSADEIVAKLSEVAVEVEEVAPAAEEEAPAAEAEAAETPEGEQEQ